MSNNKSIDLDRVAKRLSRLKERAKHKNVPFGITAKKLAVIMEEESCPACHKKYTITTGSKRYLTIDRLIPSYGYVDINIVALCSHCNGLKEDRLPDELRASDKEYIATWIEKECATRNLKIPERNTKPKSIEKLAFHLVNLGKKIIKLGVWLRTL